MRSGKAGGHRPTYRLVSPPKFTSTVYLDDMVRDDLFDGVFRQERGLGGGREKDRRGRGKKGCDQNKRLSPYFAIPFMAQPFGRRRRGTSRMQRKPPLPVRLQASNTWQARASRLHTGRGWAGGHQAGAQFAKSSQSISPWRVGACEHTDSGRRPRHAARTLSVVAVAPTTVASNKKTHRGRVMAEGAALAGKQRAGGQLNKKTRCV